MKGYRMVLLVNGGLFLFVAVSAFLLSRVLEDSQTRCVEEARSDCSQTAETAHTAAVVTPFLVLIGLLLLGLGIVLGRNDGTTPPGGGSR